MTMKLKHFVLLATIALSTLGASSCNQEFMCKIGHQVKNSMQDLKGSLERAEKTNQWGTACGYMTVDNVMLDDYLYFHSCRYPEQHQGQLFQCDVPDHLKQSFNDFFKAFENLMTTGTAICRRIDRGILPEKQHLQWVRDYRNTMIILGEKLSKKAGCE